MKIFKDIKNSVYNPSFYNEKKNEKAKDSVFYFIKLKLIESLLLTIIFSIIVVPAFLLLTSKTSVEKIVNLFPEDLTINIKDGQASTNVTEPYLISNEKSSGVHKNMLVIDTKTPFSIELFKNSDTNILLTKDYFVGEKNGGQITIESLKKIPDVELNRIKITGWVYTAIPYLKFVIPLVLVIYFFAILTANTIGSLIVILIGSFIVWCVMKIKKSKFISFKQMYKLGLHCITTGVILNILLSMIGLGMPWYLSLAVYLTTFFFNVKEEREIVVSNPQV